MAQVLLLGMATADFVFGVDAIPTTAQKYRATTAQIVGGGIAANAAVAVARLGGDAILATRLGDDAIGDMILDDLRAEGVNVDHARRSPQARSSYSAINVDPNGERQIINFRGEGLGEDTDWLADLPATDAILADTRWAAGAQAAMALAKTRDIPGVIDGEAPTPKALLDTASHVAFSAQGLSDFTGDATPTRALDTLSKTTAAWLAVTDGPAGVHYTAQNGIAHAPAFAVDVKDTLGAGDIWHGAFALRLAEGAPPRDAITFANAAAAIKCSRTGGRIGCPNRKEVETFLSERTT